MRFGLVVPFIFAFGFFGDAVADGSGASPKKSAKYVKVIAECYVLAGYAGNEVPPICPPLSSADIKKLILEKPSDSGTVCLGDRHQKDVEGYMRKKRKRATRSWQRYLDFFPENVSQIHLNDFREIYPLDGVVTEKMTTKSIACESGLMMYPENAKKLWGDPFEDFTKVKSNKLAQERVMEALRGLNTAINDRKAITPDLMEGVKQ